MIEKNFNKKIEKEPHFISSRLLDALGGIKIKTLAGELVDKGSYLWGIEDREKSFGLFKHVLLVSRVAYNIAKDLQEKFPEEYKDLNLQSIVETAILHDVVKIYAQDRERISDSEKELLGIKKDFSETDIETEEVGISWLRDLGFPNEVLEGIKDHFPMEIIDDPYWKIVLVSDFMTGQKIMSVHDRLQDVRTRWVEDPIKNNRKPKIDPLVFDKAAVNITLVAKEIFSKLETTDEKFVEKYDLNNPDNATRWEKFLMGTYLDKSEFAAKRHVKRVLG